MSMNNVFAQNAAETTKATVSQDSLNFETIEITMDKSIEGYITSPKGDYYGMIVNKEVDKKNRHINTLSIYSTSTRQKLWQITYYAHEARYIITDYCVLEIENGKKLTAYERETGQVMWDVKPFNYVGCKHNLVIGFRTYAGSMLAFSQITGEKMWSAAVVVDNGLSHIQAIDDDNSYMVTTNLHSINWKTGERKKVSSKTCVNDKGALAARIALGVAAGVAGSLAVGAITGGYYNVTPIYIYDPYDYITYYDESQQFFIPANDGMICGLTSQIISDNGKNYYADRDGMKCFDDDMNIIWKTNVPNNRASKSYITLKDDAVLMFNYGFGMRGGYKKQCTGRPFFAAFNTTDGSEIMYEEFEGKKLTMIGVEVNGNDINMLLDNAVASVTLKDKSMRVSECDTLLTGSFTKMLSGDNYYVKTSEKEFAPIGTLTNNVAAYTSKHKIVEVGIKKTTPSTLCYPNQLYSTICKRNGNAFIIGSINGTTELWCIRDGKAIKMYDDVVSTNLKDNTLEVLTNNGKLYLLNLL